MRQSNGQRMMPRGGGRGGVMSRQGIRGKHVVTIIDGLIIGDFTYIDYQGNEQQEANDRLTFLIFLLLRIHFLYDFYGCCGQRSSRGCQRLTCSGNAATYQVEAPELARGGGGEFIAELKYFNDLQSLEELRRRC